MMKKAIVLSYRTLSIFIMITLCAMLTGCGCYYQRTNHLPVVDGELNPSGINKVETYRVIGRGIEPEKAKTRAEGILMAERAAITDGYRQLVEKLHGIYIDSQSQMNNGSVNYSLLYSETQAWLRGAEVIEITRLSNGITEAEIILRLNFVNRANVWCPTGPISCEGSYSTPSASPVCTPKNGPPVTPMAVSCPPETR
ncbi:LPP20 family lipoprotein [Desulfobacter latus]|uniref:Lipoprotein n=1 Tax=Desulfobacter latus TaxID=2292 RepID=A0A850T071_9BACT|nr:hypothetical protein [Desulfobacter latus]NWH05093.1 hypothetical protein [Desulfobacter latus]